MINKDESKSIQRRKALQVPKRMSDGAVAGHWDKGIAVGITDKFIAMNELAPQLERDHLRARANEERLEIILDTEREEGERLRQWEQTIILSPGDAREIALKRFRESDFARDIVEVWRKENADLKARVKELEKPAGK